MIDLFLYGFNIEGELGSAFYIVLAFIVFDVLTGLLAAMRERKINSSISFNGIITKLGELLALFFLSLLDTYFLTNGLIIKTGVGLLLIYEGISIVENFSRIGVNLDFVVKYFDKDKVQMKNENRRDD